MTEGLSGFHAPSELLREKTPPAFFTERRATGEDTVLLIEPLKSFLPMLNTPGRTCLTSLAEVTAYSWTLGIEWGDLPNWEGFGRELDVTSVVFADVVVMLVIG